MTGSEQDIAAANHSEWTDISDQVDFRDISVFDTGSEQSAVCLCTVDGTIIDATKSFVGWFGDPSQQPVGSSLDKWLSAAHGVTDTEELLDRLQAGESIRRELSVIGSAGETRCVVFKATPVDDDGRQLIVAICHDITAQRRAEQRHALLAEVSRAIGEAERYEQGLERTLQAICTYTEWAYGEVWTPNDGANELTYTLGYTDEPALEPFRAGSTSVTFAFGEGLPGRVYSSQSPEWIPDASNEPLEVFHRAELASDTGIRAAFGVPVMAGERVVAVLAFFLTERREVDNSLAQDVSAVADSLGGLVERKQTEERIHRQNERLAEFASVVSHDLRNPLNVATGALEMVRDETDSEYVERVANAHERMDELIEDMLVLAKQGKTVDSEDRVVLADSVQTCWRTVETPEATVEIDTDRVIRADRSRLRQIIENLLRNAVVHAGPETTVRVGDLDTGFYIADDGPGVPADVRETVFQPGHTTHTDGNGLGLSIVQDIVNAHGWQISLTESKAGGARFEITNVDCAE